VKLNILNISSSWSSERAENRWESLSRRLFQNLQADENWKWGGDEGSDREMKVKGTVAPAEGRNKNYQRGQLPRLVSGRPNLGKFIALTTLRKHPS